MGDRQGGAGRRSSWPLPTAICDDPPHAQPRCEPPGSPQEGWRIPPKVPGAAQDKVWAAHCTASASMVR